MNRRHLVHALLCTALWIEAVAVSFANEEIVADQTCPHSSQHQAAAAVLNMINPISIRKNIEYGGYLYRMSTSGFCSSIPVAGDHGQVNFSVAKKTVPPGSSITATWHTHGAAMEGVVSEIFSPQDLKLNQQERLDGYLATPSGAFKYLPLGSDTTQLLGTVATR